MPISGLPGAGAQPSIASPALQPSSVAPQAALSAPPTGAAPAASSLSTGGAAGMQNLLISLIGLISMAVSESIQPQVPQAAPGLLQQGFPPQAGLVPQALPTGFPPQASSLGLPQQPVGNPFAILPSGQPNPFETNPLQSFNLAPLNGQSLSALTKNPADFILKSSPLGSSVMGNRQFVQTILAKDALRKQGIDPNTGLPLPPKTGAPAGAAANPLASIFGSVLQNLGATPPLV